MRALTAVMAFLGVIVLSLGTQAMAEETRLTIVHTDDLHSHFLGFSPNADYTPLTTGDDATLGGWARISTLIQTTKAARDNPVLVLDGGDFLMGSLFHTVSREEALELGLLGAMGYDVTTLGNHEFDLKPEGLARIIESAAKKGAFPAIVSANVIFDPADERDDRLEQQFRDGRVTPYTILERDGLRIGVFGLMGTDAAEVAPFARPVQFADPIETARRLVDFLRNRQQVDVIICLSHSGLNDNPDKSEDVALARAVDGIDVIISGHTDTFLPEPIVENGAIIVHARGYGLRVGVLDLDIADTGVDLAHYDYITVDDSIPGDPRIDALITAARDVVNRKTLGPLELTFDQVVAETDFDLTLKPSESTLGNLVTDALRWAGNKAEYDPTNPASRVAVAVISNGPIRDDIIHGKTGQIAVSDLFRVVPLGIGSDGSNGYPLVSVYVTARELKKTFEILTTLPGLKGNDYVVQISGAKVTYNPNRMLFDRVTDIQISDGAGGYVPLDYSSDKKATYKVVTDIYNATFLKVIGSFTKGILTIVPKDHSGAPIEDLTEARIDADPGQPGIQERKVWGALIDFVQTFHDTNGNGLPDIPASYAAPEGRQVIDSTLNPFKLLAGGNYLTWSAVAAIIVALLLCFSVSWRALRLIRHLREPT